jgi:hypothetical protein
MTRAIDPMFDQRIADWLEDDPTAAPAEILEIIVAALPSVPQRRTLGSALDRWSRPAWVGMAAAVTLAVGLAGLLLLQGPRIGPAPSPTATASPAALTKSAAAPLHHYAASLPEDWTVALGQTEAEADTFSGPDGTLTVTYALMPGGSSQEAWALEAFRARIADLGGSCLTTDANSWRPSRVGVEGAYEWELPCINGLLYITGVGDRGNLIQYVSTSGDVSATERDLLRRILLSFELDQGQTIRPTATSDS